MTNYNKNGENILSEGVAKIDILLKDFMLITEEIWYNMKATSYEKQGLRKRKDFIE